MILGRFCLRFLKKIKQKKANYLNLKVVSLKNISEFEISEIVNRNSGQTH